VDTIFLSSSYKQYSESARSVTCQRCVARLSKLLPRREGDWKNDQRMLCPPRLSSRLRQIRSVLHHWAANQNVTRPPQPGEYSRFTKDAGVILECN
jgi:hypothetical protein